MSGTYQDDNHFWDVNYTKMRSISETSFDMVGGGFYNWDDVTIYPEFGKI